MDREEELARAAGFFEGDGWFASSRSRSRGRAGKRYLRVAAGQKSAEPLTWLHRLFGGSLNGPDKHGMFHWAVQGTAAEEAAHELAPYLSERRRRQLAEHQAAVGPTLARERLHFRELARERRRERGQSEFNPHPGHEADVVRLEAERRKRRGS
jgi:hypothetical protein